MTTTQQFEWFCVGCGISFRATLKNSVEAGTTPTRRSHLRYATCPNCGYLVAAKIPIPYPIQQPTVCYHERSPDRV